MFNAKRVDKTIAATLSLMIVAMITIAIVQFLIPEFMMTGCGITITTVAVYFSLELNKSTERTAIDLSTGVKNIRCYEEDIKKLNIKYFSEDSDITVVGCVVCNIVNLKVINEEYGLLTGDKVIQETASMIVKTLPSAYNIYRISGDIFTVLYVGVDRNDALREVANLRKKVYEFNKETEYDYYLAIGFEGEDSIIAANMEEIIFRADKAMARQKERIKKKIEKEQEMEEVKEEVKD